MRLVSRLSWVFGLLVFSIGGCSEVSTPPDAVQVHVLVKDGVEQIALEGANICQTETTHCVTTNANGSATLELPANQKLSYTVEKEGYGSLLYPVLTGKGETSANLDSNMNTEEGLADAFTDLQSPYPMGDTGMILVVISPRFAGATLKLINATGKAYYTDEEGNWSSDLQATTSGGTGRESEFATGGFVEVPPGEFQVEIGGEAQRCALSGGAGALRGWPGDTANRIEVPVRKGFETRALVRCPPPL